MGGHVPQRKQTVLRRVLVLILPLLALVAACAPRPAPGPQGPDPLAAWRPFLECTIDHESRSAGTYWTNTGNGYFGAYQFLPSTWAGAISRAGHPEYAGVVPVAPQVPPEIQDIGAVQLASERGAQPWGNRCSNLLP